MTNRCDEAVLLIHVTVQARDQEILDTKIRLVVGLIRRKFKVLFGTTLIRALNSAYTCLESHSHRWRGKDFCPNSFAVTGK